MKYKLGQISVRGKTKLAIRLMTRMAMQNIYFQTIVYYKQKKRVKSMILQERYVHVYIE